MCYKVQDQEQGTFVALGHRASAQAIGVLLPPDLPPHCRAHLATTVTTRFELLSGARTGKRAERGLAGTDGCRSPVRQARSRQTDFGARDAEGLTLPSTALLTELSFNGTGTSSCVRLVEFFPPQNAK
jgi:hypothetical protein